MTFQTRFTSWGSTVGTRLMARDTVAVDTLARLAISRMSISFYGCRPAAPLAYYEQSMLPPGASVRVGGHGGFACCLGHTDQVRQHMGKRTASWFAKGKIQIAEQRIKFGIYLLRLGIGCEGLVFGADSGLRLFYRFECARGQEGKDGRTQCHHVAVGHQHGAPQNIGVNLVKNWVFQRNSAGIDYTLDLHLVLQHPVQDDPDMKRGALDGGKQFLLRRALQVPAQSDAAQVRINQHSPVAVIPGHAQQSGLAGAVIFQAPAQRAYVRAGAGGDGAKDISYRREPRFNSRALWMN